MTAHTKLLRELAGVAAVAPPRRRWAALRAAQVALGTLSANTSLPLAARWFLKAHAVRGGRTPQADPWDFRVTPPAAAELRRLVLQFVVLYGEAQQAYLVGNSGAGWAYSVMALLPAPPAETLQPRLVGQLFDRVLAARAASGLRADRISGFAHALAPADAVLRVRYEYEHPDWRLGHLMMRLELDGEDVVTYWPGIDDPEFNVCDLDALAETCERLGLRHVRPLQLATFLTVLANATADGTASWGGERGVFFFQEGNIPFVLKRVGAGEDE